jgi:hypothetical protein
MGRMSSTTTRIQAIKPLPWTASLPLFWLTVVELQETFEHHATVPPNLSAGSKVPRYSPRLSEVMLSHDRRSNASLGARRNNTAYPYLLRAMVSCGTCRLGCIGRSSRGGYAYYVCVGKSHGTISHRDEKCSARSVPVEQLDELVWQDVCDMLMHPDTITTALYRAQGGQWLPEATPGSSGESAQSTGESRTADGTINRCLSGQCASTRRIQTAKARTGTAIVGH